MYCQIWRYLSYSLVHAGLFHVTFNILVQLVLGIPLEMVHAAHRVAAVYLSGVLAGSLWTSVIKPEVFLSGASGGVYALITAHLGTVIMNHREMSHPWVRVGVVSLTAATDVCVYIYQTAGERQTSRPDLTLSTSQCWASLPSPSPTPPTSPGPWRGCWWE